MKRRFLATLLSLCATLALLPATAQAGVVDGGSCGENVTWSFDDGTLTISGTGAMADYESEGKVPWKSLRKDIQRIVIENGVTHVGARAFIQCGKAASVTIAESVTSIGAYAFAQVGLLEPIEITIPAGAQCKDGKDGSTVFSFSQVSKIHYSGTVLDFLQNGDRSYFMYTCGGERLVGFSDGKHGYADSIGFCGDRGDKGDNVWWMLDEEGTLTIGGEGKMKDSFYHSKYPWDATKVEKVVVEEGVTYVSSYAFHDHDSLTRVEIGTGVTAIGEYAFFECDDLKTIALPSSLTKVGKCLIGDKSGKNSASVETVEYGGTEEQWKDLFSTIESTHGSSFDKDWGNVDVVCIGSIPRKLVVRGGTGGGAYYAGDEVTIAAHLDDTLEFTYWYCEYTSDSEEPLEFISGDWTTPTVTFKMPAQDIRMIVVAKELPPVVTYAVAVEGGTGSGKYAAGQSVTIKASAPEIGKRFKEWTGASELTFTSGGAMSATATFTMPAEGVTLTATYEKTPYTLTVEGGTGGGTRFYGDHVSIKADAPATGKRFKEWTSTNKLGFENGDVTSSHIWFTMPAEDVTLTAIYEDIPYKVKLTGGFGGGIYTYGASVTIRADAFVEGKQFKEWVGTAGLVYTSGGATSAIATFTMPAKNVTLAALYEDSSAVRAELYEDSSAVRFELHGNSSVAPKPAFGDVDGNGEIDLLDFTQLCGYIAEGYAASDYPNADMNGDGQIDSNDVLALWAILQERG